MRKVGDEEVRQARHTGGPWAKFYGVPALEAQPGEVGERKMCCSDAGLGELGHAHRWGKTQVGAAENGEFISKI